MSNKIKLIWDFRGPDAKPIAEHHAKHLKEFASSKKLQGILCGTEDRTPLHAIAYMVVSESEMGSVRDALRPHRGQVYEK
jgi:hypothetical protein